MNTCADNQQIEYDIANISQNIKIQQQYVNVLTEQRINNTYQYDDDFIIGQTLNLTKLIKQKNELNNKLQSAYVKRVRRTARSYSPGRIHYDNNDIDIVRIYKRDKRDKFEKFLDFIIAILKILRFVCIIAFIIIKFVYVFAYAYNLL